MANESIKFYRGEKADLPLRGENGSIYITSDSGDMYMDTQDTASDASSGEAVIGRVQIKDSSKAPINHASSNTSYGVSSASNYGHAKASTTAPKANGTASVGSETSSFARGDHVHPLQTSVANATKATQDSAGQQINTTYIKGLSVSGRTITYTKGDNTTGTITTQDTNTTYSAATSSALGLVKSGGDITVDASGNVSVNNDSHTHSNSTITSLDASKLTGTISIDRLPKGALERLVPVEDQTARFALTTNEVQLGDTVKQLDTGVMYLVTNESELDNENGYTEYTAGSATSVPWSGVSGKPSTFTPSTHTHTISQITNISSANVASAAKATQDSAGQDINKTYIKGLSVSGKTITYTKGDGTTGTITTQDTNTTYSNFKGATSSADGSSGLVPAPQSEDRELFLKANGTWASPPATTLSSLGITATAAELNYMDGVTSNVQTQLNGKAASSHSHTTSQISNFPTSMKNPNAITFTGASTGTYDGSSALTINIPTSGAVDESLTIKLNGGSTEGTNMFTFNGSTAKSVNITASSIGAATSGHTHSAASTSAAGFMSTADKSKLDGIAAGANNYVLPTASTTLGGVKTTSSVSSASGYTACPIIDGVPYYKDTNTTYTLSSFGITATASELNKLDGVTATADEINYLDGVTSNIQTQLNAKAASSHTHNYAGSSSAGGAANSAAKLNTNAGSATQPVYFADGIPKACTYTLGKSVPSNAVFTDTNTWIALKGATTSEAGTAGYAPAPAAGAANRYLRSDGTWAVPPDTNTTYSNMKGATSSAAGSSGLVPAPAAGKQTSFLRGDGTWVVPTNTTYSAGNGLSLSGTSFSLASSGVTAGSYGPSANVTGSNNTTINIPQITVDAYGRVTSVTNRVYTSKDTTYTLPNATSSVLGGVKIGSNITVSSGTISLTKANVVAALGYTPPTTDTNTDTKVTNTVNTSTKYYITGSTSASTNTGTQIFDTGVYVEATAGRLHSTTQTIGSSTEYALLSYDSARDALKITFA